MKPKFTEKQLFDLTEHAKKSWNTINKPLHGMKRNLNQSEILALSYFNASLIILNQLLPDYHISDKIDILFEDLNSESIFE